jgi:multidrug efflux pump subunit AcrA (membrane-fusion protein)
MRNLGISVLLAGIAVLAGCGKESAIQAKRDSGPIPVRAAAVATRDVQRVVESVGTLYPFDETVISAEIDGRVDEVKVDLGDRVSAGQLLVHISEEEQRYLLAQMEAQLRQALERLGLKNENDRVQDIRETPEPRRARAELFDAEQRYKRIRNLVDQGIASQADLDQAESRFKSLQAAYDSTLFQTRNLVQEIERSKAQLDLQRKKLRDASVCAPYAGAVKERQVNVGQYVRVNTPLLTIVKTDPLRLRLEVPERMAPWIRTDQRAAVSVEAFPDRTFTGRIWRISPTVDATKRTFIVEALIDNSRHELKPGGYARARIATDRIERIRLAPSGAITYLYGSNKAYVVRDDHTIEARDVKLGDRFNDEVEVTEGLADGEQVAISGLSRLDTGVKVSLVTPSGEAHRGF